MAADGQSQIYPNLDKVEEYVNGIELNEAVERSKSVEDVIGFLKKGSLLWKVKSLSKWYRRKYTLDFEHLKINYEPSHKPVCVERNTTLDISDIHDVRKGWKTDIFNRIASKVEKRIVKLPSSPPLVDERNCFSIIIGINKSSLDLVAPDEHVCDMWVRGLQHLVAVVRSLEQEKNYDRWLKRQFQSADKDNNGVLDFDECVDLIKQLNIQLDKQTAKKLFQAADTDKRTKGDQPALDEREFVTFYHSLLKRPDLEAIFQRYSNGELLMTSEELADFLRGEQKMNVTSDFCREMIETYEPSESKLAGLLSHDGFQMFMSSKQVHIFNPEHSMVYQDMEQPMTHYFIASSHNTYLLGNQLTGMSSVEAYIIALQKGCRCVELDCWDGDDGEPVIYHGYTLTSKIRFCDVISDAIKPYAFQYSEYPLILSIENHCSVHQQARMAHHLKSILGDMLFVTPVDESLGKMPSPKHFHKKILLKAKKLPSDKEKQGLQALTQKVGAMMDGKKSPRPSTECDESCTVDESESDNSEPETESAPEELTAKHDKKKKKKMIAPALSVLVNYIKAVHFHSFEQSQLAGKWWTMSSFGESKALGFVADHAAELVEYNKHQLSRIYPSGKRQDSSNLNPVAFWNTGCQIVALNYQTPGKPTSYNQGMFRRNGGCGYVLKPAMLRSVDRFDPTADPGDMFRQTLKLRIISGAYIPKPAGSSLDDIIDPYVNVYVTGHPADENKLKTAVVKNNGFNPVWDELLTIPVRMPDFCLLDLVVRDHSTTGSNYILGHYCIHFDDLMPGYRYVPLEDMEGNSLSPASLFVHVEFSHQ
ncbi:1-phosphatidylinositol 4,5-bisphosphate phosphodiesterase eta-2-like isoform X26 [Amphibalanus amphitrite]|uniref:1-phosphatidylinositol 4,5-bisphosphate phosphodiesterase eta-2-like isoform X26 n=1 Tax=Amphibalanus amphitrite TaxID=1232801 RepID=UPI001C909B06|nr:1-phosphatidylinositol 4,5-bisphosphate phosphodiesterase eta-2-like isoform X26 [Amphibalanus amphitrite]XP_043245582.1 1-phosphatidylinositol 4,5-bisphosphate phosphodiesterase eta-2-like isoform X26 [Amphibalanus amphitrite]XP_043245583.1 1-phosphatidylinositol 4,5-bisphosphate phosphodiesterase eta-2-like isoform X26 [Amphibalanus amphitrite]XP_043245584.1 1-phosphatidylinositol 4,5-bisphosphate phosphodiesterase eta-2-like isoform X26 [Amphibalanus amphitrite]